MRKILYLIPIIPILLMLFAVSVSAAISCTETDEGKDYYLKGMIWATLRAGDTGVRKYDDCVSDTELVEFYCEGTTWPPWKSENYDCLQEGKICQDDACIPCTSDPNNCPSGYYCENGICILECTPKTCADWPGRCGTLGTGCTGAGGYEILISCDAENCPADYPQCYSGACTLLCGMSHCQIGYICEDGDCIEIESTDCSTINCADYIESDCPNDECCFWDTESMNPECSPVEGSGAKYCDYNGNVHPILEECDPGDIFDTSPTPVYSPAIDINTYCDEGEQIGCDRCRVICTPPISDGEGKTKCSDYSLDECDLNPYIDDASFEDEIIDGCYLKEGVCISCAGVADCSYYDNFITCGINPCKVYVTGRCFWDETCIYVPEETQSGDTKCYWDCSEAKWTLCDKETQTRTRDTSKCELVGGDPEECRQSAPPTLERSCRCSEKHSGFSHTGVVVVIIILIIYYIFFFNKKKK